LQLGWIGPAAAGVLLLAGFVFLIQAGDRARPEQKEIRVELTDAFKN
jgi:hypothetical protein